jgi:formylglycine-generating enzyme required for sulfatase activity
MARIPSGEFWMGRTHVWLLDQLGMNLRLRLDDQPAHLVGLDAYEMDSYEVTNEDYLLFVEATGHRRPYHWLEGELPEGQGRFPVYNVNWSDATAYCAWGGKRLPTEAEWERAARGGTRMTMYPWGDDLRSRVGGQAQTMARISRADGPTEVGSFAPNGLALYDMTGNVWIYRVMRGGGWSDGDARILALHYRNFTDPEHRTVTIGFRCAKSVPE